MSQVRGQAIAAVSIISSAESFLVPSRAVERRLLELCLQGAVEDVKVSGQTGEAETQNALMVMRLVEDFIFTPGRSFHFRKCSCYLQGSLITHLKASCCTLSIKMRSKGGGTEGTYAHAQ